MEPTEKQIEDIDPTLLPPGWPGYRTRPGRTGLDYIDTQVEVAHMTGVFIRQFLSGEWIKKRGEAHPLVVLFVGLALIFTGYGVLALVIGFFIKMFGPLIYRINSEESVTTEAESESDDEANHPQ